MDEKSDLFQATWPEFLDGLESNPAGAAAAFADFMLRLLKVSPPRPLQSWAESECQDFYNDLFLHCCARNFRVLKKYEGRNRRFSSWLLTVAWNLALDRLRKTPQEVEFDEGSAVNVEQDQHPGHPRGEDKDPIAVSKLNSCLDEISNANSNCRLLLLGWADGLRPRHLAILLGFGPETNKKVWDMLDACKRDLRNCLRSAGVTEMDVL